MITKITQAALAKPPMSWRRNTSIKTVITIQIQITQTEEDDHRPEDVQERIVGRYEHFVGSPPLPANPCMYTRMGGVPTGAVAQLQLVERPPAAARRVTQLKRTPGG